MTDRFQFRAPSDLVALGVAYDMWQGSLRELWREDLRVGSWRETGVEIEPAPLSGVRGPPRSWKQEPDRSPAPERAAPGFGDAALRHWLEIRFGAL